jgi:acyl-CoA thioester hydrolase
MRAVQGRNPMTAEGRYVAETSFHVRYAETDAMGIVHHASYVVYLEEGRSTYARQRGHSYAEFEATGHALAVTEVHARYLHAARYDQRLTVRCWLAEIRSRTLTFEYEIVDDAGLVLVSARTQHICIDTQGKVCTLPETWRSWANS